LTVETLGFMLSVEAGAVPAGGGKPMGVFKALDIENMNKRKLLQQELNRAQCDYCGITMKVSEAYKCHAECAQVYCAEHIVKYGGGVK